MQIEVVSATSVATRCAYCRDDLKDVPANRCSSCMGLAHPECKAMYGRCPVWGCIARIEDPCDGTVAPPPLVQTPVVEGTQPAVRQPRVSNRYWTHTLPHIAVGVVVLIILFLTQPPLGLVVLALAAFIAMSLTDPREEEEAS